MDNKPKENVLCTIIENYKFSSRINKIKIESEIKDRKDALSISILIHKSFMKIIQKELYSPSNFQKTFDDLS